MKKLIIISVVALITSNNVMAESHIVGECQSSEVFYKKYIDANLSEKGTRKFTLIQEKYIDCVKCKKLCADDSSGNKCMKISESCLEELPY